MLAISPWGLTGERQTQFPDGFSGVQARDL
jgi:hypothetical protein